MTTPRLAITGGHGFLGWHTSCRLRAIHGIDPHRPGRTAMADAAALARALEPVTAVLHLAGVNRGASAAEVEHGNVALARVLADALEMVGHPIDVVYADSVQAELDTPYGRGKATAAQLLGEAVRSSGGRFADLLLPHLFGEHGRPAYNSFVATFASEVAAGRRPTVTADRELQLLHVQDAARELIGAIGRDERRRIGGEPRMIGEVLRLLEEMHVLYGGRGEIPPLPGSFETRLFNTYRSATFPGAWPRSPETHIDERGLLFETVRSHGGTGQSFVSTTRPGQVRGDHYHLHKVERFFVVRGQAEISLRRLLHDDIVTFKLDGDRPSYVDMPTLWTHRIRNVGDTELVTMFWADRLLDASDPDQYAERVVPS